MLDDSDEQEKPGDVPAKQAPGSKPVSVCMVVSVCVCVDVC